LKRKRRISPENRQLTIDFHTQLPLKSKWTNTTPLTKIKKNIHFKSLQTNLQGRKNRFKWLEEELKELINPQENTKDTLKHFNELRDQNAGAIPKDKYNHSQLSFPCRKLLRLLAP
jgi:hypothetical protein